MDLICKVRLYQDRGDCFAVLIVPGMMCSSIGRNVAEALANLGCSMAEDPLPRSADLPIKSKERKKRSPVGRLPSDPREIPRAVPFVKRLLEERSGKTTLCGLSEKLGLDDVTPQLPPSSIAGNGAKRVRLATAEVLGEDADAFWPTARY